VPQYIYIIKPTKESFIETGTEDDWNSMSEHFQYLKTKLDKGELYIAGPETNTKFGIAVFDADDDEEANSFMLNDPAVKNKVVTGEVFPFRVSLLKK